MLYFSGNPWQPGGLYDPAFVVFAAALILRHWSLTGGPVTRFGLATLSLFAGISTLHALSFQFLPIATIVGFLLRMYVGFAVVTTVKCFPQVFARVLCWLAAVSLVVHSLSIAGMVDPDWFRVIDSLSPDRQADRISAAFHTFFLDSTNRVRNSGMFWEPGAFAGYLIFAMVWVVLERKHSIASGRSLQLCILGVTLASTLSTTGYLAAVFPVLLYLSPRPQRARTTAILLMLLMPLGGFAAYQLYDRVPFLRSKIEWQWRVVQTKQGNWRVTRFGTVLFDWRYIKRRPLLGWGLHSKTRYALDPHLPFEDMGFGNGMTDFIAKMGIVGFSWWIVSASVAFWLCGGKSVVRAGLAMLAILVCLQGEAFLGHPAYLSLMFIRDV